MSFADLKAQLDFAAMERSVMGAEEVSSGGRAPGVDEEDMLAEVRQQNEQLAALVEIGRELTSTLEIHEVLPRVVRDARRLLRGKLTSLMIERAGGFETVATDGAGPAYLSRVRPGVHNSVSGRVLRTGQPVIVDDVLAEPGFHLNDVAQAEGLVSLLSVPLRTKSRSIGVLNLYTGERRTFRAQDVALMTLLAQQSAVAIENAELFRQAREAGEGLRAAEKLAALGRLSAGLAHELRNPLNTLSVLTYAMIAQAETSGLRVSDLEVVQSEVRRLNLLVDQFLDFARPRAPRFARHRLEEILEETLLLIGPEAAKREIGLDRAWQETPAVWADGDQLKQVFLNLMLNGLQAIGTRGRLRVSTRAETSAVVIEIRDTGPGMAPEILERLFEPFVTTRAGGTGLGLPISLRIIEAHSGKLTIGSQPGEGATAVVRLPV
jgi:signal transduction histidine kinase